MTNSTLISRLMGPILLFMGIGAVIGLLGEFPEAYVGVLREINNQSATVILGMFALLAGLAIVNTHNLWVSDWRVIITILGWLAIVRGALSLLFPNKMYGIGEALLASRSGPMIGAVIILVLGGILSWMGYRDLKARGKGDRHRRARKAARPRRILTRDASAVLAQRWGLCLSASLARFVRATVDCIEGSPPVHVP